MQNKTAAAQLQAEFKREASEGYQLYLASKLTRLRPRSTARNE